MGGGGSDIKVLKLNIRNMSCVTMVKHNDLQKGFSYDTKRLSELTASGRTRSKPLRIKYFGKYIKKSFLSCNLMYT